MDYRIPPLRLPVTGSADVDFSGGELTSDGGVLLLAELASALGVRDSLRRHLASHPLRAFDDADVAMQRVVLCCAGYHADDDATALRRDPAISHVLGRVASQETMSRRLSAMGASDVSALERAVAEVAARVGALSPRTEAVVDVDTTLLASYGSQEGAAWNFHYSQEGLHPAIAVDTLARDVVGFELRPGAQHCAKGAGAFIERALESFAAANPRASVTVRADAGFASEEAFAACEAQGAGFAVRLKANPVLRRLAEPLESLLEPGEAKVVCGEFPYRAGSWSRERRVVCCSEMAEGELLPRTFFVATDMAARPSDVIAFYRQRGAMELVIGELKEGYLRNCVQSRSMDANAFRCLLAILAYRLANWLRLLALPGPMRPERTTTIRASVLKVAARRVRHGRRTLFRMPSSCPHKAAVVAALRAIERIAHAPGPPRPNAA